MMGSIRLESVAVKSTNQRIPPEGRQEEAGQEEDRRETERHKQAFNELGQRSRAKSQRGRGCTVYCVGPASTKRDIPAPL